VKRTDFVLHLISEVAHYMLDADPMRLVISLHQEEDGLHLAVFDDTKRTDRELEAIRQSLKNPDRPELAGYYGSMVGFDMIGAVRLDLIGWQIKAATVSSTAEGTRLDFWLGGDRFNPEKFSITPEDET
jgi:hypothetical protein